MLDIDAAIKHCLDIADGQDKCAEISVSEHAKERISQCAADHRQLAEWLRELKDLREENKVLISECDRLIKEKGELLSKVSGSDVLRICQLEKELEKAKRLLKAAVEDFRWLESHTEDEKGHCCISGDNNELACIHCPLNQRNKDTIMCGWNYEAEALALIGEDANVPAGADDTNVGGKIDSWISCKDKMPEDNTSVLFVYVSENGIKSVHYGYHQTVRGLGSSWGKISGGWRYCNDDVTHWMPIPEPPKE